MALAQLVRQGQDYYAGEYLVPKYGYLSIICDYYVVLSCDQLFAKSFTGLKRCFLLSYVFNIDIFEQEFEQY